MTQSIISNLSNLNQSLEQSNNFDEESEFLEINQTGPRESKSSRDLNKQGKTSATYRHSEAQTITSKESFHQYILDNFSRQNGLNLKKMSKGFTRNDSNKFKNDNEEYDVHCIYEGSENLSQESTSHQMDQDPKFHKILDDDRVVKSSISRQVYLPFTNECPEELLVPKAVEKTKEKPKPKKKSPSAKPKRRTLKVLKAKQEKKKNPCLQEILGIRDSEIVPLYIEPKRPMDTPPSSNINPLSVYDEYFGLNDWGAFHISEIRPYNFNYCKVYHKLNSIMINTCNSIVSLLYSLKSKSFFSIMLYQNEQPQIIEEFVCYSDTGQTSRPSKLIIKNLNDQNLRFYDIQKPHIKRRIKLGEDGPTPRHSLYTGHINFFENNPLHWRKYQKRNTLLEEKIGNFEALTNIISEKDIESLNGESQLYCSNEAKVALKAGLPLTQYLEHDQNNIFYLDNHFMFSIFDERKMKNSFCGKIFESDYRGSFVLTFSYL